MYYSLVFILLLFVSSVLAVEEPEGYRTEYYDDVVPDTLTGSERVSALEVLKLQSEHSAIVIDVIPEHRKPDVLPEGQIWLPVPHKGVAGALWLPDVGYGDLSATTERYFKQHLQEATSSDLSHPVVFYCRIDCWMSWNAAKRALSYGYTRVFWFADGIDDWMFEGLPLETLKPAAGKRH